MEPLDEYQARVVGALVEKQRTVPDIYPLTLNALVAACNQTSNREPVVAWDDHEVGSALDELKGRKLVRFVHPGHGRSVTRYRHVLDEAQGLDATETGVLAVLLLRGPQTVNEIRARTERYAEMDDVAAALERLADQGLVERRRGAREPRWADLLTPWRSGLPAGAAPRRRVDPPEHPSGSPDAADLGARVTALEREVTELRSVVDRLRELL